MMIYETVIKWGTIYPVSANADIPFVLHLEYISVIYGGIQWKYERGDAK